MSRQNAGDPESARAPSATRRPTGRNILVGALLAWVSCEPGVISPLPSPIVEPDDSLILTSSLTAAAPDEDFLVAVVGLPGATTSRGTIEVKNSRTGATKTLSATDAGTFSAAVYGQVDDQIELRAVADSGEKSDAVLFEIRQYTGIRSPTAGATDAEAEPAPPNEEDFAEGMAPGGAANPDNKDDVTGLLPVYWWLEAGTLNIEGRAGFTSPNVLVVASNATRGTVDVSPADSTGAVVLAIEAEVGDEILLFTQSPDNPTLTSPATRFLVPAPRSSGQPAPPP